jgi:hypothetical protein
MEVTNLVARLTDSPEYKAWLTKNPGFYLVHLLYMSKHPPQVGFYSKTADRMFTFDVGDSIVLNPEAEVFKNQKTIAKLELGKVKIDKPQAMDIVAALRKEKYPTELLLDSDLVILQQIKEGLLYNITHFTKSFKTLNIKVDAADGKIISHEIASLVGF